MARDWPGSVPKAVASCDSDVTTVLHMLTRPQDPLPQDVIARQQRDPNLRIDVADLTLPEPDYDRLLDQIFAADSVQVW